jgi:hypothetical protein
MEIPYGTIRRAPAPSFAHAIKIDQGGHEKEWEIIDLYGSITFFEGIQTEETVKDWPIVYTPMPDDEWSKNGI